MTSQRNPAQRRYVVRLAVLMTCYVAALSAALHFIPSGKVTGPLAYVLEALPGVAFAGAFWAIGRLLVEETDEFLRMLLVRQSLFASGFALSITTIWGFLENVGLVRHVDAFYVAILWFLGLGLGSIFNRLTVGSWSDGK